MRKYWILVTRSDGRWGMWFGAWDRADVVAEADDAHDQGIKRKDMRVVWCGPTDRDIEAKVAELNNDAR